VAGVSRGLRWWSRLVACLGIVAGVAALVFSPLGQPFMQPFYLIPPLAWVAIEFTWGGTLAAMAIMAIAASIGINPYAGRIIDPSIAELVLDQALLVAGGFAVALSFIVTMQRRNLAKLRDVMTTLDLGVFIARELNGKILFWSKGAEKLYGYTNDEALGRITHDLLQTQHPVPVEEIEHAVVEQGEWRGDLIHTTKDGRVLTVAVHKVRRVRKNGEVVVLLEAITDVTAERRDQAMLADLIDTLEARVNREVMVRAKAAERMKQASHFQALGRIAGGVAHEFNNILQVVSGALNMIENHPDDTLRVFRFTELARTATERGAVITERLLGFARKRHFKLEPVDPAQAMVAFGDVLSVTLGATVRFQINIAPDLPVLMLDKTDLQVALVNLATNARDAMPDGGMLTVHAAVDVCCTDDHPAGLSPGRYVRIAVADTGTGMDAKILSQAMEPFFTTKEIGKGTGLGLSMVKGFVEQSGGGLSVTSAPGEGTTVTLWLPVKET
jgi:PAS domain S-box-containing protein